VAHQRGPPANGGTQSLNANGSIKVRVDTAAITLYDVPQRAVKLFTECYATMYSPRRSYSLIVVVLISLLLTGGNRCLGGAR